LALKEQIKKLQVQGSNKYRMSLRMEAGKGEIPMINIAGDVLEECNAVIKNKGAAKT